MILERSATKLSWQLVEALSQLLDRDDCEAVKGDIAEADLSCWQAMSDVLGLVVRRQVAPWRSWRPWLAVLGLGVPGSFLLMGFSLSVSQAYQQLVAPPIREATGLAVGPGFLLLACNMLLLIGWSWTGGYVMGSLSRRTVRVSVALSFLPCLFCLSRFRVEALSRFTLLLFLPAAIWGLWRGLHIAEIKLSSALGLALGITLLTIPTWSRTGEWIPNWALSWPAWYLAATARRPIRRSWSNRNGG